MVDPAALYSTLRQCGVDFFTGVPDSLLKNFCAYLAAQGDSLQHIIATNEGSALALAMGHHLASYKVPLVYLQNSGLGNLINPLLSLADPEVYSIPLLMVVGWRGEPGVNDEPQHIKQGRITPDLLEQLEIPYRIITAATDNTQAGRQVQDLISQAKNQNRPCALLVSKGCFSDGPKPNRTTTGPRISREQAIEAVLAKLSPTAVVVATTGFTSRELFELRAAAGCSHQQDFLTVGGMGHASQIALGIALAQPERQVYCLDGDGAFLMHIGGAATCATTPCNNFKHIVLNNGVHDSVGGQPTIAEAINIAGIAAEMGYHWTAVAQSPQAIDDAIDTLDQQPGPALLEIKIKPGARNDLGRPTTSPVNNKIDFMNFLRS